MIVYGVIRSGTWGFVQPKPDAPQWLGMSPVVWLLLGGAAVLALFAAVGEPAAAPQRAALLDPRMLKVPRLQGGLTSFFFQFMLQAGLFFVIPLFLSVALGLSRRRHGRAPAPPVHHAPGQRRRRPQALPARLAAADRADRLRPLVPRHRRAPGGARRRGRRRHRDRAAAAGRARDRHPGLTARRRHRLGGARLPERRGRRRPEHRDEPRRVDRHRAVRSRSSSRCSPRPSSDRSPTIPPSPRSWPRRLRSSCRPASPSSATPTSTRPSQKADVPPATADAIVDGERTQPDQRAAGRAGRARSPCARSPWR